MNASVRLDVYLEGIGLLGPGLPGWSASLATLSGTTALRATPPDIPAPDGLPPAERRRVGMLVRMALAVGRESVAHSQRDATTLANVFSASSGDGDNCHAICEALAGPERVISPTRFHNSVHNAAGGYWGIAMKCMAPSTSLCAHDGSFAAGLLESAVQARTTRGATLLVASDAPYPEPLNAVRPMRTAFGVSLVVAAQRSARAFARLSLSLTDDFPTGLPRAEMESLRLDSPAARALPLLQALASPATSTRVLLPYLDGCTLAVAVELIGSPAA